MKYLRYIAFLCALVVSLTARAAAIHLTYGPYEIDAKDRPVVLRLADYPQFSEAQRPMLGVYVNGREIASQLDDLDGDGIPDELAFLIDCKKGARVHVCVKPAKRHKTFEPEVFAEMYLKSKEPQEGFVPHTAEGKSYYIKPVTEQSFYPDKDSYHSMHHHGVAFESALMAYRIYFDKKQTIDVYAKKTPRLELDACKWYPTDEQLAQGFGDDVLRVSGYIGVGTCKPWNGQKMVHFQDENCQRTQRIVSQGPVRTVCEVTCCGNNGYATITTRYTLYARHRDVMAEVFSYCRDTLVTGVQKVGEPNYLTLPPSDSIHGAIVASWGTAWPVNDTVKYAKETVGLAVYVPEKYVKSCVRDANNNLILLNQNAYIKYFFTVVSLKENEPPATNDKHFFYYVEQWAKELEKSGLAY